MELLILSTLTGITTMFGALAVLLYGQPGKRILAFYLGMSAGIMILVVFIDLLPAAFEQGPVEAVGMGLGAGIFMMIVIFQILERIMGDRLVGVSPKAKEYYQMGWLISLAIGFHNIPEGIAIGAGFEAQHSLGILVALSIGLHNVPEGVGMAIPFVMAGVSKKFITLISLLASLCIPLGAWLGKLFFVGSPFLVAMGIAFAAGAMGYIVWKEIAPASLKHDRLFAMIGMGASVMLMYLVHILR